MIFSFCVGAFVIYEQLEWIYRYHKPTKHDNHSDFNYYVYFGHQNIDYNFCLIRFVV